MTKVFDFLIICFYAALGYLIWDKIDGAASEKIFLETVITLFAAVTVMFIEMEFMDFGQWLGIYGLLMLIWLELREIRKKMK